MCGSSPWETKGLFPHGTAAPRQPCISAAAFGLWAGRPTAPAGLQLPAPPPTSLSREWGEWMSEMAPGLGWCGFPQALHTCSTWPAPPGKRRPLGWVRVPAWGTGVVVRAGEGALPGAVSWDLGSCAEGTFLCRRGMQSVPVPRTRLAFDLVRKGKQGGLTKPLLWKTQREMSTEETFYDLLVPMSSYLGHFQYLWGNTSPKSVGTPSSSQLLVSDQQSPSLERLDPSSGLSGYPWADTGECWG